jgi:RNA polymerase sigma factor (sigma-70 family)
MIHYKKGLINLTHIEELRIIQDILYGDTEKYEQLVIENQKNVYNLALRMTGNPDDALDISQEVFLKAYTNLKSFRGDSLFSSWLYRLTYNMCIDLSRKNKRRKAVSLSQNDNDGEDSELFIPDTTSLPETELEKKELRSAIANAVCSLSPEHRNVFIMREYRCMSYEEIAEALCVSQGTVKSRLSRARKRLASYLISQGTFEGNKRHKKQK